MNQQTPKREKNTGKKKTNKVGLDSRRGREGKGVMTRQWFKEKTREKARTIGCHRPRLTGRGTSTA